MCFTRSRRIITHLLVLRSIIGYRTRLGNLVMRASSPSMSNVASTYSLNSSGRGTTFSSSMESMVCVLSCGCVRRMCSCVCACEHIARTRGGDKGFKNVPAPARQTPPTNPENYTFRFPQDKKWVVVQNSCPKVGRSFFGKKGQHFLDSIIRSGLSTQDSTSWSTRERNG